jgi:hypothetical protein
MASDDRAKDWDVFISHASEDKEVFVRPLAGALKELGMKVWYDEFTLRPGDSITRSIDKGILGSSCGLVVISPKFIEKNWPEYELRGLTTREISGNSRIIPIWYEVDQSAVERFSPSLADKMALRASGASVQDIALKILMQVRPDLYESRPRSELIKLASGEAAPELMREVNELNKRLDQKQRAYEAQSVAYGYMEAEFQKDLLSGQGGPYKWASAIPAKYNNTLASYLNRGYDYDTARQKADEDIKNEIRLTEKFQWVWLAFCLVLFGLIFLFIYLLHGCTG